MEVRSCMLKLLWMHMDLERYANREEQTLLESQLPQLWILTPTASSVLLESLGAKSQQSWPQGVYFTAEVLKTAIVAIQQLPVQKETLWLRLLGKSRTQ